MEWAFLTLVLLVDRFLVCMRNVEDEGLEGVALPDDDKLAVAEYPGRSLDAAGEGIAPGEIGGSLVNYSLDELWFT
jgi:hypothetical protein